MAKRFTDTDKYKKPFIRGLNGAYKLLWDYLYHDCNHAGIWIVDFDIAQIYLGSDMLVNKEDALKYFNKDEERVIEFEKGKWFIPSFIDFQYGELNQKNRAHNSVINILSKNNLINNKGLIRGLYSPKDKDKVKDKYKDKILNSEKAFDLLVENNTTEFESFLMQNKKLVNDWDKMVNSFNDKIDLEIAQNKIEFKIEQLLPRLSNFCRNWVGNQKTNPKGEDIIKQLKSKIAY